HQQMMSDPMKPLGLSFFLLTTPAPMRKAGGRLFVDVTHQLASSVSRNNLLNMMGQHDPLMKDALLTIVEREGFIKSSSNAENAPNLGKSTPANSQAQIENDPTIVPKLIERTKLSIEELKQNIQTKSGSEIID